MKRFLILSFLLSVLLVSFILTSNPAFAQVPGELIWFQPGNLGEANGVAVDSTGVYIIGNEGFFDSFQWRIEKRNLTDGSIIWSQTSNPGGGNAYAYGVAVDSTGVYIVGSDSAIGNTQWRIEKRNLTDGSLIWAQTSNPSTHDNEVAYGVALDSTGIYIVGADCSPRAFDWQWRIEKRNLTDGSLIWFRTNNPDPRSATEIANGVALDSTGIYIVGDDFSLGYFQWRMEKRSLTDGTLIWTRTSNPSVVGAGASGVDVDITGVYIVGESNSQWRMEKRSLTDGSLIFAQPTNISGRMSGVALDNTGIYIVGSDNSLGNWQWRIEKRGITEGSLIWAQTSNPSSETEWPNGIALDSTGIYIVGNDGTLGSNYPRWRIEKRVSNVARITVSGEPRINTTITLNLDDALNPNKQYILAMSFGRLPGIPLGDGRIIPLNLDPLMLLSLQNAPAMGLFYNIGTLNAQGQATVIWNIPNIPELVGATVYAAFIDIDPNLPFPQTVTGNSAAVAMTLRP